MLAASPAAPIEVREPPGSAGCAPVAQATRLGPRDTSAATKIKEKETKHYGKRSSPFKAPKPRQAHASLSLHSRVGGREAKGEGSPFPPPPRAPRHSATPKFSRNLQGSSGEQGSRFSGVAWHPSIALWYLAVLKSCMPHPLPPWLTVWDHSCASGGRCLPVHPVPNQGKHAGDLPVARPWQVASVTISLWSRLPGPGNRAHLSCAPGPRLPVLPVEEEQRGSACRKHAPAAHVHLTPRASRAALLAPMSLVAELCHLELHPEVESLGKARPSPLIVYGEKPAPAHPAHTGIRKRNPHPAQAKAHRAPVTHGTRSLSIALCPQHRSP